MKDTAAYKGLEALLKNEKAGSAKIRALAHWLIQERVKWRLEHDCRTPSQRQKLITEEASIEFRIYMESFKEDAAEYLDTYENAFELLQPSINKFMDEGRLHIPLVYLREINREKSKLAKQRALENKRAWEEYR